MDDVYDKIKAIKAKPEEHQHRTIAELQACCRRPDNVIDTLLMEVHSTISTRSNGGRACDVQAGPCSCGAWHKGI